jgi:hypothetical protein
MTVEPLSLEARRAILDAAIPQHLTRDTRLESRADTSVVLVRGRPVNHLLHFFVGLFTCGLWWVWWLVYAIMGGETRELLSVDEAGTVTLRRFGPT